MTIYLYEQMQLQHIILGVIPKASGDFWTKKTLNNPEKKRPTPWSICPLR